MANEFVRVSVRIYQHEMPELYSKVEVLESRDRSRFVRRELLIHELLGCGTSQLRNMETTTALSRHSNTLPIEQDKLLFDDDIVL